MTKINLYHKGGKKRFEYYLRVCKDCEEIFEASTQKTNYCDDCMKIRMELRAEKSRNTRKKIREEINKDGITIKN
jgi:hypothetical protein